MAGFSNSYMTMAGQSLVLAAAQTDNVVITSSIIVVTPQNDGDEITGAYPAVFAPGLLFIVNIHPTKSIVLPYDDAGSEAGYRWLNVLGHALTIGPGETSVFAFVPNLGWEFLKFSILT
jgi:hypothetical protein